MLHLFYLDQSVKRLFGNESLEEKEKKYLYPMDYLSLNFFFFPFCFSLLIWLKVLSRPAILRAAHCLHIIISCLVIQHFISRSILLVIQTMNIYNYSLRNVTILSYPPEKTSVIINNILIVNFIQLFSWIIQEGIFKLTYLDSLKLFLWHL